MPMDPALKTRITNRLKHDMPALPARLQTAAKYLIDHPSDFGLDPIRTTAQKTGVSTYTLVRLAEMLGFEGYDALRAPFRQALVSAPISSAPPGWLDGLPASPSGKVQARAAQNEMAIVERSLERQDHAQMSRVVEMLLAAPAVYLTAVRASYGLAYHLHYVGRMALPTLHLIPRHMNSAIDELHLAQPGEVMIAITFTPYSRETIEACAFARRKGLKLIIISDSEIVSPDFRADETLIASVHSTHHFGCYAGAMAVIETLIALLVDQGGSDARARIASYEDLRQENQAYWAAQRKAGPPQ
ncbi:MAG: MurR/RpiR family transcriptional regulator [Sulfitobacter sp.]